MSKASKALAATVKKTPNKSAPEPGVGIGAKLRAVSAPPKVKEEPLVEVKTNAQPLPWEDEPMSAISVSPKIAEPLEQVGHILESLAKLGIAGESPIPSMMPSMEHKEVVKVKTSTDCFEEHPLLVMRKKEAPIHANTSRQPLIQNATFGSSTSPLGTVFVNPNPVKKDDKKKSTAFFASSSSSIG